jgi:DNA-directed RNA polymerase specialized sigma24 family protein
MSPLRQAKLGACLERLRKDKHDADAWRIMYGLLYPRVMATNYRRLGGLKSRAEDATQDVFFRLVKYSDFSQVRTPEQFLAYVKTICESVCAELFQELRKQTVPLEEGLTEEQEKKLTAADPEQLAVSEDLWRKLGTELQPEEFALLQLVAEGYKDQEIADRMEWSYAQAGVRVFRLRARVRNLLKLWGL